MFVDGYVKVQWIMKGSEWKERHLSTFVMFCYSTKNREGVRVRTKAMGCLIECPYAKWYNRPNWLILMPSVPSTVVVVLICRWDQTKREEWNVGNNDEDQSVVGLEGKLKLKKTLTNQSIWIGLSLDVYCVSTKGSSSSSPSFVH